MSRDSIVANSFGSWLGRGTVLDYFRSLDRYRAGFEAAFLLKNLPIVPDTNVLINHMHIPADLAEKTRRFLEANSSRVILPVQIQAEYKRHRPNTPFVDDSRFVRLPSLDDGTIHHLCEEFDRLATCIDQCRVKAELATPYKAFPGLADLKKKPDRAHADYLILHEMMAYVTANDTDLIFLTRDVDKGDWLTARRRAYPHVIETVHLATGHCIFVLEAPVALDAALGETSTTTPAPFTDFEIYRARFMVMWERLKERKSLQHGAEAKKGLSELRRVRNVLVQHDRVSDGFLDRKWLLQMEEMLQGDRLVDVPV